MNSKTKRLTTTGILIAIASVLFAFPVIPLPFDGELTLAGMVPIIIIGYKYGVKWGWFSGLAFSLIQIVIGATTSNAFAAFSGDKYAAVKIVLMTLLDYIIAFSVIGLSGVFKNKIKNDTATLALGAAFVSILRFCAHFLSGWILWGSYAEWFFTESMNNSVGQGILEKFSGQGLAVIYSFIYNGSYMLPELIVSVIVCVILISVKPLKKYIVNEN